MHLQAVKARQRGALLSLLIPLANLCEEKVQAEGKKIILLVLKILWGGTETFAEGPLLIAWSWWLPASCHAMG